MLRVTNFLALQHWNTEHARCKLVTGEIHSEILVMLPSGDRRHKGSSCMPGLHRRWRFWNTSLLVKG